MPTDLERTQNNPSIYSQMLKQIGPMNILAISGGRKDFTSVADTREVLGDSSWVKHSAVVTLPVANGYRVEVAYDSARDAYQVTRWYVRGRQAWAKTVTQCVYAAEVGEAAYQASCYR
jgi:hypothetical protein